MKIIALAKFCLSDISILKQDSYICVGTDFIIFVLIGKIWYLSPYLVKIDQYQ